MRRGWERVEEVHQSPVEICPIDNALSASKRAYRRPPAPRGSESPQTEFPHAGAGEMLGWARLLQPHGPRLCFASIDDESLFMQGQSHCLEHYGFRALVINPDVWGGGRVLNAIDTRMY